MITILILMSPLALLWLVAARFEARQRRARERAAIPTPYELLARANAWRAMRHAIEDGIAHPNSEELRRELVRIQS